MAIDRIGKGGALPPAPEGTGGAAGASPTATTFKVDRAAPGDRTGASAASGAGHVDAANAATPLARLRAGEVDVHGYVDLKVDEATSKLGGLSTEELADIKSVLRDQMRSDPGLTDLVRTATGKTPSPPED
jgi:hypothetical protein